MLESRYPIHPPRAPSVYGINNRLIGSDNVFNTRMDEYIVRAGYNLNSIRPIGPNNKGTLAEPITSLSAVI